MLLLSDNPAETVRLMEAAKKHIANKKPKNRKRKTEFRFDVNHKDKSNLV
jgi:ribosomal protein L35